MMMRTSPCSVRKSGSRRKENEACAGNDLWKIDISGRKWPITLIDEGTEPRKSGVYFLDKRPRSFDNDYRQVVSLTKARWLTLRCSELARRCREKGSGVVEAKWEGSRENLGRTPKIKLETGNEA